MICLFMVSVLASPALAQDKNIDIKRIEILQTPAYFTADPNAVKYSEQLADTYLQMTDNEFKEAIKSNLEDIVAKINKGSTIFWNKDFVEKLISKEFGENKYNKYFFVCQKSLEDKSFDSKEIYNDISSQVEQQEKILDKNVSISPTYTPGDEERTFSVYGDNAFGMHLFGLFCKVELFIVRRHC